MQTDVILKRFEQPDETRIMKLGRFEIVRLGGITVGRATYRAGSGRCTWVPSWAWRAARSSTSAW